LFIGGFVPSLVFGVAFGNLLVGTPFSFDADLRVLHTGTFWALLNPFALLAGLVSVAMLVMHGAAYLQLRMEGVLQQRARQAARLASVALIVTMAAAGLWIATGIDGYRLTALADPNGVANPLAKSVVRASGAWLDNYARFRWMLAAPIAAFAGALGVLLMTTWRRPLPTLIASGVAVSGVILTAGFSMFPFIMPSSSHPASSLTLWDAVSSHRTLQFMFWITLLFLPLITLYTSWAYYKMRGTITPETLHSDP
jgi:cytochrome d ubiquinol oxidase subunit II